MRLSDLLAAHPELDTDVALGDGDLVLDGLYLFRVLKVNSEPGESVINIASTGHTDGVIKRGLVKCADEIGAAGWGRETD